MDKESFYHRCWLTLKAENPRLKKRMDDMIRAHHNLPKEPGVEKIRLAGEVEKETEDERRKNGIPLHPEVVASLQKLADELDMEYNL